MSELEPRPRTAYYHRGDKVLICWISQDKPVTHEDVSSEDIARRIVADTNFPQAFRAID